MRLIRESGQRLLALVNSILGYTSLMSGRVQFKLGLCAMDEVCEAAVRAIREQAAKKGQTVALTIDPAGLAITSNPDAIAQVLHVLLANAVKFTPEGGRSAWRCGTQSEHSVDAAMLGLAIPRLSSAHTTSSTRPVRSARAQVNWMR